MINGSDGVTVAASLTILPPCYCRCFTNHSPSSLFHLSHLSCLSHLSLSLFPVSPTLILSLFSLFPGSYGKLCYRSDRLLVSFHKQKTHHGGGQTGLSNFSILSHFLLYFILVHRGANGNDHILASDMLAPDDESRLGVCRAQR